MIAVILQVALLPTQKVVGRSTGPEHIGIARSMAGSTLQRGTNGAHKTGKPLTAQTAWLPYAMQIALSLPDGGAGYAKQIEACLLHRVRLTGQVLLCAYSGLTNPGWLSGVLSPKFCAGNGIWGEAGLLPSLSMQDILWAMLAQPASHQALLDACMRLVRHPRNITLSARW